MQGEKIGLKRVLGLRQATVLNMIDMVGIGPFAALPIILLGFPGKFSVIPWIIGAIISLADGMIWAELGSAWPEAGGSFIFLQKLYKGKTGRMMAFLYSMQTSLHLPLVVTSAALGLVNYLKYVVPMGYWETKLVMVAIVAIVVGLLYRKISSVGKIGMAMSVVMVFMLLWTIGTGAFAYDSHLMDANSVRMPHFNSWFNIAFWMMVGQYTSKTVYAFLGYYNVCHIGGEIKNPHQNIPRSILLSIGIIAILYIAMQWFVAGAVPISEIKDGNAPLLSIFFEKVYGKNVAYIVTGILVIVACSSLFALMLGYSRIIYAAAKEGLHFKLFAHLHPTKDFPDYVLLVFGGIAIIFCICFEQTSTVFSFIVVTRIFIQFIPQAIGVIMLRVKKRTPELHFKMPAFPILAIFSILVWVLLFISSGWKYGKFGIGVILFGYIIYKLLIRQKK
ncbi:APC family permease [Rhizosphaericola mali]|uniref:APC family permease n=1 Tax=Rhizosphaericola mali TaxID=2545455 RepID=A0A5P2G291_9BACT|nr:APC family permease [Rhizosphaericola mali]QES89924.1 APC family permease [Rhizosphaericola mali]